MHTDTKSVFICANPWLKKTCVSGTLTMAKKKVFKLFNQSVPGSDRNDFNFFIIVLV